MVRAQLPLMEYADEYRCKSGCRGATGGAGCAAGKTPEERLLLRFYRQLDAGEQVFMRRVIEALATRDSPS